MEFHRTVGDAQLTPDGLVASTLREVAEDLALPRGKLREGGLGRKIRGIAPNRLREDSGELLGNHGLSGDDPLQGDDQLIRLHILEQIAPDTGLEGNDEIPLIVTGGQHHYRHSLPGGPQSAQNIQAAGLEHAHVEQHDIGDGLGYPADTLFAVADGVHDLDAPALQQLTQANAEQGVVVDQ